MAHDVTTHVVDREKQFFQEVFVRIGSRFTEQYLNTLNALEKLKQ